MARNHNEIDDEYDDRITARKSSQNSYNLIGKKFEHRSAPSKEPSEPSEEDTEQKNLIIEQGLDFMLEHFTDQEALWPRNISTAITEGKQRPVSYEDTAISYFLGALRKDCRLACYPNYEEMVKEGLITSGYRPKPSHIFIDLDLSTFKGNRHKLYLVLKATLRNMKKHLNGAEPTVIWSGGGYHIHQPLDLEQLQHTFEDIPEFARFENPSVKFLRYAERKLTNGESDPQHSISFKSCMARVPGSMNIKYEGEDSEVKIIQRWNKIRAEPTQEFLITDFYVWLVQQVLDEKNEELRMQKNRRFNPTQTRQATTTNIAWIERLLQTPIADYRKHTRDLIIIPYLIVCKGMTDRNEIYDIVMNWADKCNELRRLEPSRREFSVRVRIRINEVMQDRVPPMTLNTLKEKNRELYERLGLRG
jgi:hypothetical protein